MHTRHTPQLATPRCKNLRPGRTGLWLSLAFGVVLLLASCDGLASSGGQFRPVPDTSGKGVGALAINLDGHFQGHIAFVRNHHLYTLSGRDGTVTALPAAGTDVQDPAYSPDGTRLAYIRRGFDWSDLMMLPTHNGQPIALTHDQGTGQQMTCPNGVSETDTAYAANPIWTPDGSALYYLSDAQKLLKASCGFQDMAVWKIPAQGGAGQFVLWPERGNDNNGQPGAGGDANLSLRPGAGNELAYTHYAYDTAQSATKLVQVFLATLDQQQPAPDHQQEVALAPATNYDSPPRTQETLEASWSPNGKFLAYIIRVNGANSLAIMPVSDPARGAPDFLDYTNTATFAPNPSSHPYSYPVWSPDGKSLLYLVFDNNEYNLYLAHLTFNGTTVSLGSPIQLTQGGVDGDSRPSWTSA